jgi:ATP-dependent DNA helicase RecG
MGELPPGYELKQGTGTPADRAQLVRFLGLAYGFDPSLPLPQYLTDTIEQFFAPQQTPLFFMTEQDQPIGCLWIGRARDQRTGHAQAYIFLIAVDPAQQRRGLGTYLMSKAQEQTQAWGLSELTLQVYPDNQSALKLYEKLGFVVKSQLLGWTLELERQKRNISFDEEICYEQSYQALDIRPMAARFEAIGKNLDSEKLKNLKLIKEEKGKVYPTHALMVLLGKYEHVMIKCARFKGKAMGVFLDKKEYGGDLFFQLEAAEGFIKNHINLRGEIKGLQRTDTYEIPTDALREALVNAIIHRDYSNRGRDIKVGVYDDLVNIVSPGGFPSTLTAEDILEGRSEVRNKVIARVFKELNYIEQWGSGIKRIQSLCIAQGLREPIIRGEGDFVDVEFYRPGAESDGLVPEAVGNRRKPSDKLSLQEEAILAHLTKNGKIVSKEVEAVLLVKESRARELLREMTKKALIGKKGSRRSTYYTELKV